MKYLGRVEYKMVDELREDVHAKLIEVLPPIFKRLLTRLPNQVPGGIRLTPDQYGVLVHVGGGPGCSMGDIAAGRGIALNSATALVDRLVALGAAERTTDPADRRIVRVVSTVTGLKAIVQLRELRRQALRQMLEDLGTEDLEAIEKAIPALDKLGRRAEATR